MKADPLKKQVAKTGSGTKQKSSEVDASACTSEDGPSIPKVLSKGPT